MIKYSIKDLESISGIKAHTLRIWEVRYELFKPHRTDTNIRLYSNDDIRKLLNIALLNNHGLKISKIATLSNSEISSKALEILSTEDTFQSQINSLTMAMVEIDEDRFELVVSNSILKFGLEDTITQIIYPFLVKVGVLWRTESINPGQEHFITNLIRQKIIAAIDAQVMQITDDSKKFLLYLPENELHEISILFYNYLIRKNKYKTIYLGQSVPFEDVVKLCDSMQPTHVITVLTAGIRSKKVLEYIEQLSKKCNKQKILLSGYQVFETENIKFENVHIFKNKEDLSSLIFNH
jgi:DNA-binding transcriptional MerR regulator